MGKIASFRCRVVLHADVIAIDDDWVRYMGFFDDCSSSINRRYLGNGREYLKGSYKNTLGVIRWYRNSYSNGDLEVYMYCREEYRDVLANKLDSLQAILADRLGYLMFD